MKTQRDLLNEAWHVINAMNDCGDHDELLKEIDDQLSYYPVLMLAEDDIHWVGYNKENIMPETMQEIANIIGESLQGDTFTDALGEALSTSNIDRRCAYCPECKQIISNIDYSHKGEMQACNSYERLHSRPCGCKDIFEIIHGEEEIYAHNINWFLPLISNKKKIDIDSLNQYLIDDIAFQLKDNKNHGELLYKHSSGTVFKGQWSIGGFN